MLTRSDHQGAPDPGPEPSSVSAQRYVDGAASDNLPRCGSNNTVTISAYAGESDLCPPRGSRISFHQVRFNNVSIQVNAENVYRVTSTFFPPEPQVSRASRAPPAVRGRYYILFMSACQAD